MTNDMEKKMKALEKLHGFTEESLIAYAVECGAITPQELREYLKTKMVAFAKVLS